MEQFVNWLKGLVSPLIWMIRPPVTRQRAEDIARAEAGIRGWGWDDDTSLSISLELFHRYEILSNILLTDAQDIIVLNSVTGQVVDARRMGRRIE